MKRPDLDHVVSRWVRLGVLFGGRSARRTPDIEHLLLDTARIAPRSARLFYLAITWLSQYGNYVARHRLKHLVGTELAIEDQSTLGPLLALAVRHGAPRGLLVVANACASASAPQPLFDVHRGDPALAVIAEDRACPDALPWNRWVPDQPPKSEALRPATWLLARNPVLHDRIVRKGDLRCSILVTLRLDAPDGEVDSEVALADLCSANRIAVRRALGDLELEGHVLRRPSPGARNTRIALAEN